MELCQHLSPHLRDTAFVLVLEHAPTVLNCIVAFEYEKTFNEMETDITKRISETI